MKRPLLIVLALGCGALTFGSTDKASQAKVTQTKASQAKATQEKESYLQKANQEIQDWTAKIKALEERSQERGVKTRQDLDQRIKVVDDNLAAARKKLEELRNASENAWKSLQDGLDKALEDIKHHYQKAATTLEKDKKKEKS